jgi:hypothetical protein
MFRLDLAMVYLVSCWLSDQTLRVLTYTYESAVRVQHASSYKHMSYTGQSKINIQGTHAAKVQVSYGANRDKTTRKAATASLHRPCSMNIRIVTC